MKWLIYSESSKEKYSSLVWILEMGVLMALYVNISIQLT